MPYTPNLMLFYLTSNITKYLTSSDMNYLALLSVCAAYAPDFFYVYNLSDWFREERSLKLKSRMWLEPRASPPIWMSTLVRNRLLADGQTFPGFPAPIQSFLFFNLVIQTPVSFSDLQKIAFFGPPTNGICFTSDMNANFSANVLP